MSHIKFLKSFVKKPGEIGAVMPSSRFLAHAITSEIGLDKASAIAELGPGTGAFTKIIIENINHNTHFFVVERNKDIFEHFQETFPDVTAYNCCASDLKEIVSKEGISSLDIVISGLPWAAFPAKIQIAIINSVIETLTENGVFTTFAYLQGLMLPAAHRFKALLKNKFSVVKTSKVVWRNTPPAFVYRCRK